MRNVEIKAKVRNLATLISKVKELSKENGVIIKQHDTFYKIPAGRLKLRKFEEGNGELIYYERPDVEGPKMSSYDKCPMGERELADLNVVLTRALGVTGIVKKTRQLYMVGQTRVHVDSVESLGDFMELEVCLRDDQTLEEGQAIAENILKDLDINKADLLATAYTDLLQQQSN